MEIIIHRMASAWIYRDSRLVFAVAALFIQTFSPNMKQTFKWNDKNSEISAWYVLFSFGTTRQIFTCLRTYVTWRLQTDKI